MSKRGSKRTNRWREILGIVISVLVIASMAIFYVLPPPSPPDPAFPTFAPSVLTPVATNTPASTPTTEATAVVAPPAPRPPTPTPTATPSA